MESDDIFSSDYSMPKKKKKKEDYGLWMLSQVAIQSDNSQLQLGQMNPAGRDSDGLISDSDFKSPRKIKHKSHGDITMSDSMRPKKKKRDKEKKIYNDELDHESNLNEGKHSHMEPLVSFPTPLGLECESYDQTQKKRKHESVPQDSNAEIETESDCTVRSLGSKKKKKEKHRKSTINHEVLLVQESDNDDLTKKKKKHKSVSEVYHFSLDSESDGILSSPEGKKKSKNRHGKNTSNHEVVEGEHTVSSGEQSLNDNPQPSSPDLEDKNKVQESDNDDLTKKKKKHKSVSEVYHFSLDSESDGILSSQEGKKKSKERHGKNTSNHEVVKGQHTLSSSEQSLDDKPQPSSPHLEDMDKVLESDNDDLTKKKKKHKSVSEVYHFSLDSESDGILSSQEGKKKSKERHGKNTSNHEVVEGEHTLSSNEQSLNDNPQPSSPDLEDKNKVQESDNDDLTKKKKKHKSVSEVYHFSLDSESDGILSSQEGKKKSKKRHGKNTSNHEVVEGQHTVSSGEQSLNDNPQPSSPDLEDKDKGLDEFSSGHKFKSPHSKKGKSTDAANSMASKESVPEDQISAKIIVKEHRKKMKKKHKELECDTNDQSQKKKKHKSVPQDSQAEIETESDGTVHSLGSEKKKKEKHRKSPVYHVVVKRERNSSMSEHDENNGAVPSSPSEVMTKGTTELNSQSKKKHKSDSANSISAMESVTKDHMSDTIIRKESKEKKKRILKELECDSNDQTHKKRKHKSVPQDSQAEIETESDGTVRSLGSKEKKKENHRKRDVNYEMIKCEPSLCMITEYDENNGALPSLPPGDSYSDVSLESNEEELFKLEKYLKEENFNIDKYSEVLRSVDEKYSIPDEVIKELSFLEISIDWQVHPAHMIETKVTKCPTPTEESEIKALVHDFKKGRFLPSEDEIIKKNWERFSEEYGFENPRDFLTLRVNGVHVLPQKEVMNFARYLGRGLHNRSLYGIMRRFRCLYDTYKKGRLSTKEKEVLESHVKLYGRELSVIRKVLGKSKRSIESCAEVVRSAYKAKSFKSDKEKGELFKAILEVTGSKNYEELQGKRIDWQEVGNKLEVSSQSCKHYWKKYLHGYITLKKPLHKTDVHCKIIESLEKMNVESSKAVDWNKVSEDVYGLPSAFLWNVFADLCHSKKIKYTGNHWKEAMENLTRYYYPAAKANSSMAGVFPVYQPKNSELQRVY